MLFKPELAEAILRGEKTESRRLKRAGDKLVHSAWGVEHAPAVVTAEGRMRWIVGKTYAIQPGRGKKAIGRFLLVALREEQLQEIIQKGAVAEGWPKHSELFPTINTRDKALRWFKSLWDNINKKGARFADNPAVWVLTFDLWLGD